MLGIELPKGEVTVTLKIAPAETGKGRVATMVASCGNSIKVGVTPIHEMRDAILTLLAGLNQATQQPQLPAESADSEIDHVEEEW